LVWKKNSFPKSKKSALLRDKIQIAILIAIFLEEQIMIRYYRHT